MKTKINNREVYIKWKHNNNTPNGNPEQVIVTNQAQQNAGLKTLKQEI